MTSVTLTLHDYMFIANSKGTDLVVILQCNNLKPVIPVFISKHVGLQIILDKDATSIGTAANVTLQHVKTNVTLACQNDTKKHN